MPDNWIQKARITDIINVIQLLNTPVERPQLFRFLIKSIDLTMFKWLTIKELIEFNIFSQQNICTNVIKIITLVHE